MKRPHSFETRSVHAGAEANPSHAVSVPIYQSSTFRFDSCAHGAELSAQVAPTELYTRWGNPTAKALEEAVADLEGGEAALAFSSGMGAGSAVVMASVRGGDHCIAANCLYAGMTELFESVSERLRGRDDLRRPRRRREHRGRGARRHAPDLRRDAGQPDPGDHRSRRRGRDRSQARRSSPLPTTPGPRPGTSARSSWGSTPSCTRRPSTWPGHSDVVAGVAVGNEGLDRPCVVDAQDLRRLPQPARRMARPARLEDPGRARSAPERDDPRGGRVPGRPCDDRSACTTPVCRTTRVTPLRSDR